MGVVSCVVIVAMDVARCAVTRVVGMGGEECMMQNNGGIGMRDVLCVGEMGGGGISSLPTHTTIFDSGSILNQICVPFTIYLFGHLCCQKESYSLFTFLIISVIFLFCQKR